jgi:hypothetical protein
VNLKALVAVAGALSLLLSPSVRADKLDDIIASGKLRCAVVLDFPPMGSRDEKNEPIGYDVDTCNDLAKALGVKAEIVETPFPDRIPALVSGRADIGVASTSDTLQRAKTIGFSIPYFAFKMVVLTKKGTNISSYNSLKGRKTGSVTGTFEAIALEKDVKKWNDPKGSFRAYQTQADVFLALSQGQIEANRGHVDRRLGHGQGGQVQGPDVGRRCAVRHRLRRVDRVAPGIRTPQLSQPVRPSADAHGPRTGTVREMDRRHDARSDREGRLPLSC